MLCVILPIKLTDKLSVEHIHHRILTFRPCHDYLSCSHVDADTEYTLCQYLGDGTKLLTQLFQETYA